MSFGRAIVRLVLACFLGTVVALLLFAAVALVIDGQLQPGSFHSGAAAVLVSAPIFWGIAFWWLARVGFPPRL